jgi:hypothetical protein
MRIGSSTLNQNKTLNKSNIIKNIIAQKNKKFNPSLSDSFNILNGWDPISGVWSTDGNILSTPTSPSLYPILTSFDLRSQNITATMSLDSAGAGIAFWVQDASNWWAAVTYYTFGNETVLNGTATSTTNSWYVGYHAVSGCTGGNCTTSRCPNVPSCCGCWPSGGTTSSTTTTCNSSSRTKYSFFIRILKSVNGTVTEEVGPILLRTTCSQSFSGAGCSSICEQSSADNINGIELTTFENTITLRARNDSNSFYGTSISTTPSNPNRGYKSGIIYSPGGNYLLSSLVSDISIVGN